ncbi:MAG: PilZ domain-containing protein [Alphaproteobacteria bacterium]|nr:PilZ domain-containing protein [Alphaproteobacteria bacterium]
MKDTGSEQRRHHRHDIPMAGSLHAAGVVVPCRIRNISASGALVEAEVRLRLGDWATIKIPDFGSMTGRIVRVTSTFFGLSFSDGEAAVDAFILEWLALNKDGAEAPAPDAVPEEDGQPV